MKSRIIYFLVGVFGALAVSSANATPAAVYNDPYTGYVLCVNKSTKLVTYPAKLKCPSGFKKLELGAQGADGAPGPAGVSTIKWAHSAAFDIVADGYISSGKDMARKVLMHIDGNAFGSGWVSLTARIYGFWSDEAKDGDLIQCYFQHPTSYVQNSESRFLGVAEEENINWNSINLTVNSMVIQQGVNVYLVCRTSGTVKELRAYVEAIPIESYQNMGTLPNP